MNQNYWQLNISTWLVIGAILVVAIGEAIYHHVHNEHVQAAQATRFAQYIACVDQANNYIQDANTSTGALEYAYDYDWNAAMQQCKQEY